MSHTDELYTYVYNDESDETPPGGWKNKCENHDLLRE